MKDLPVDCSVDVGHDRGRGNLVGVQPFLTPQDYRSAGTLQARLAGCLEQAQRAGWLNPLSVVVFPEYIGTWLLAADEHAGVYRASTTAQAMLRLAVRHPLAFARQWIAAREADRVTAAIFRIKAAQTARSYQQVFSGLARQFEVTIVGGSILLPEPQVAAGVVTAGSGRLYNVSAVFAPDGRAHERSGAQDFSHPG